MQCKGRRSDPLNGRKGAAVLANLKNCLPFTHYKAQLRFLLTFQIQKEELDGR